MGDGPCVKPAIIAEWELAPLARSGIVPLPIGLEDPDVIKEHVEKSVEAYSHYGEVLTPREQAEKRQEEMRFIYRMVANGYAVARRIAHAAYLAGDWEYIVPDGTWNPKDLIGAFRRWLEEVIEAPDPDDPSSIADPGQRDRWIADLGAEIPTLTGRLARRPMMFLTPSGKQTDETETNRQIANEVKDFLISKGNDKAAREIDRIVQSGKMDAEPFFGKGKTFRGKELAPNTRELDITDKDQRETFYRLALLGAVGRQQDVEDYRKQSGLMDSPRTNRGGAHTLPPVAERIPSTPQLVSVINGETGELLEQFYEVVLRIPADRERVLNIVQDTLRGQFDFGMLHTAIRRLDSQQNGDTLNA